MVCHPACRAIRFILSYEDRKEPDMSIPEVTFGFSLTDMKVQKSDGTVGSTLVENAMGDGESRLVELNEVVEDGVTAGARR
jgi:hypothetical protein